MPAQPRIAFSSFPSSSDLQYGVWERVNSRILGDSSTKRVASSSTGVTHHALTAPALATAVLAKPVLPKPVLAKPVLPKPVLSDRLPGAAPRGVWQLLAANNRELGRSARAYPSFREALSHVAEIREAAAQLALRVDRHQHLGTWFWIAEYGDEPVITSARFFGSAAEAAKTATGAVLAIALAAVDELPRSRPARRCQGDPARENSDTAPW
ncbi:hypothetical protein AB4Y63_02995 [Leifsonia sp. YAF41]|uniref:hypothetical protein n=1 Tax=Leifsonia sp. YAF41 TaxID=3233086 RepID=UPI003F9E56F9